jgi:hypothetical protein
MEKQQVENEPFIPKQKEVRLVKGNRLKIRRHNLGGFMFARDMYHTLLSLHSIVILLTLITMYVMLITLM